MRKLNIEVREDSARPEGGHAVIRFVGLEHLPDTVTYRIKPVEGTAGRDADSGWPDRERTPLATRLTPEGAELVVGPEIVENPNLLPGTLAIIEIAKCGVRGELLWPRIAPVQRPKRRHLIGVKAPREPQEIPAPAPEIVFREAVDASSVIDPAAPQPVDVLATAASTVPATPPERGALHASSEATATPGSQATSAISRVASERPASSLDRARRETEPGTQSHDRQRAAPKSRAWLHVASAAALSAVAVVVAATFLQPGPVSSPDTAPRRTSTAPEPAAALAGHFSVGTTSPRGVDVAAVAPERLLEHADRFLHGASADRDTLEAAFLLRRYLGATLGQQRTIWALTQLGSLYAEPVDGSPPDYQKARQLWEMASAMGDGVAMCFLGALHEHGLGVPADHGTALRLFQRARDSGGCPAASASIERLGARR